MIDETTVLYVIYKIIYLDIKRTYYGGLKRVMFLLLYLITYSISYIEFHLEDLTDRFRYPISNFVFHLVHRIPRCLNKLPDFCKYAADSRRN